MPMNLEIITPPGEPVRFLNTVLEEEHPSSGVRNILCMNPFLLILEMLDRYCNDRGRSSGIWMNGLPLRVPLGSHLELVAGEQSRGTAAGKQCFCRIYKSIYGVIWIFPDISDGKALICSRITKNEIHTF